MSFSSVALLRKLAAPFSLPDLLGEIAASVRDATGAERAVVALASGEEFRVAAADGPLPRGLQEQDEFASFLPLMKITGKTGRAAGADALRESHNAYFLPLAGMGIRHCAVVPVHRYGAILCYRSDSVELRMTGLADLSQLARLAIEVSRFREERTSDELTGSLTPRLFMERLNEEVSRATTHGRSLTLLLFDLDGFRKHSSEEVLKICARVIRDSLRTTDLFSRYQPEPDTPPGLLVGDEFHLLLPETEGSEGARIAHRLRALIDEKTGLTASVGIATFPGDADSSETLLVAAAEALDRAKETGDHLCDPAGNEIHAPSPAAHAASASREGRVLEEMLLRVFASDLDLSRQLDLAAALLSSSTGGDRSILVALDAEGRRISCGRDRFPEKDSASADALLRSAAERREVVRPAGAVPGLCLPLAADGTVVAAAYVEGRVGQFQETMLSALAPKVASAIAESIRFRNRREEARHRRESIAKTVAELRTKYDFSPIVGDGSRLMETLQLVARAAETDAPVLVLGESGTGKELVARAVHSNSRRRKGPFVVLNCAALPLTLLESELFGHVKGAFTGAHQDRSGLFESAHEGTIFLDEIAEMPPETQAKLLRAVQFGEVQHLGSDRLVRIDARVVAATNRDLIQEVREKRFREDLFFRINVFQIEVPPLRDHIEDLPAIARHSLARMSREMGRPLDIEDGALDLLRNHPFPGNVRELENLLLRAAAAAGSNTITSQDLPDLLLGGTTQPGKFEIPRTAEELTRMKDQGEKELSDRLETSFLRSLLSRTKGNVSEAARLSGANRTSLQKMLSKHRIDPAQFKTR